MKTNLKALALISKRLNLLKILKMIRYPQRNSTNWFVLLL
jgi:hypothetical protein